MPPPTPAPPLTFPPIYVINLADSRDRWDALNQQAVRLKLEVRRVEAVDCRALREQDLSDLDSKAYKLRHGHTPLPAEYGCYQSHLKALEKVSDQAEPFAVIVEDDATFVEGFCDRVSAIIETVGDQALVKLYNGRLTGFKQKYVTAPGDFIGRATHGPYGGAVAYLIPRGKAEQLRRGLSTMRLPFDIALERDWSHGVRVLAARKQLVTSPRESKFSTINRPQQGYRSSVLPTWQRIPTALFRGYDYGQRTFYALFR